MTTSKEHTRSRHEILTNEAKRTANKLEQNATVMRTRQQHVKASDHAGNADLYKQRADTNEVIAANIRKMVQDLPQPDNSNNQTFVLHDQRLSSTDKSHVEKLEQNAARMKAKACEARAAGNYAGAKDLIANADCDLTIAEGIREMAIEIDDQ